MLRCRWAAGDIETPWLLDRCLLTSVIRQCEIDDDPQQPIGPIPPLSIAMGQNAGCWMRLGHARYSESADCAVMFVASGAAAQGASST